MELSVTEERTSIDLCNYRNQLFSLNRSINDKLSAVFRPLGEKYGLTQTQYQVLYELRRLGGIPIGMLAKQMNMDGGNFSSLCKKMEHNGVLKRIRRSDDERIVTVSLTPVGEQTLREIDACLEKSFLPYWEKISDETLAKILETFVIMDNFCDDILKIINESWGAENAGKI